MRRIIYDVIRSEKLIKPTSETGSKIYLNMIYVNISSHSYVDSMKMSTHMNTSTCKRIQHKYITRCVKTLVNVFN